METERTTERLHSAEIGVFEETATLRRVLMWGAPGVEAVLAQLLPKRISCFECQFKVLEARDEFAKSKSLLESQGVKIVSVKDLLVDMIRAKNIKPRTDINTLRNELKKKGRQFYETYKGEDISGLEVLDCIDPILDNDVLKYGESEAVILNDILSLQSASGLPLANVLYARDQSNLLGKVWVWSSMEHEIRRDEVRLYKEVLEWAGIVKPSEVQVVEVSGEGKFEGGDGIVHNGICYIGVGGRTNLRGVTQIAPVILSQGMRLLVTYDSKRTRKEEPEMDAMHLDTFWMPCGTNKIVACCDEVERRKLIEMTMENGKLRIIRKGLFKDYMSEMAESGTEIVKLTKYEQLHYAPNFLNLDQNKVVLSLAEENGLTEELGTKGMDVLNANLKEITKGYGGLHCLTAALERG